MGWLSCDVLMIMLCRKPVIPQKTHSSLSPIFGFIIAPWSSNIGQQSNTITNTCKYILVWFFFFNLAFKREPDVCKFVTFCFYNHVFTFSCPFNMFNLYLSYLFKLSFDFKSPTTRVAQQLLKPFLNLVLNVLNFLCF